MAGSHVAERHMVNIVSRASGAPTDRYDELTLADSQSFLMLNPNFVGLAVTVSRASVDDLPRV
jgi:hypothetical protein